MIADGNCEILVYDLVNSHLYLNILVFYNQILTSQVLLFFHSLYSSYFFPLQGAHYLYCISFLLCGLSLSKYFPEDSHSISYFPSFCVLWSFCNGLLIKYSKLWLQFWRLKKYVWFNLFLIYLLTFIFWLGRINEVVGICILARHNVRGAIYSLTFISLSFEFVKLNFCLCG